MAINNTNSAMDRLKALQAQQAAFFKNPGQENPGKVDPRAEGSRFGRFPGNEIDTFKPADPLRAPEKPPLKAPPAEQAKPAGAVEIAKNFIAEGDKGPSFRPEKDGQLNIFEINDLQPSPFKATPARSAEQQRVLDVLDNKYDIISNFDENPFGISAAEIEIAFAEKPNLTGQQYFGAEAVSTDFRGQDLSNADLRFATLTASELSDVSLQGADLSNSKLTGANLKNANLQSAILNGANLVDANLEGANLRGADLSNAQLTVANFKGADLQGAKFGTAYVNGADFTGANLRGADLSRLSGNFNLQGALYDATTILPAPKTSGQIVINGRVVQPGIVTPFDPKAAGLVLAG